MISSQKQDKKMVASERYNHTLNKCIIFVLYLIQSLFFGFYRSLPLTYSKVPDYQTLSIFAAAPLPYSFKFIMAPFQQRFYFKQYGKRKTWIIINLIFMSLIALMLSTVVGRQKYQLQVAILLLLSLLASALKDVSTDALAVQVIEDSSTISTISFTAQQLGKSIALSIFLALISKQYWRSFGIQGAIISASSFIKIIALFIFVATIVVHFLFDQSKEKKGQVQQSKESMWQIVKHYGHFFNPKYQLCRVAILLMLGNHGVSYFLSTYEYEYIRNNLIEKQTLMFIGDICTIPNVIVCFLLGKLVTKSNLKTLLYSVYVFRLILCLTIYSLQLKSKILILLTTTIIKILLSSNYFLVTCFVIDKARGSLSGLNITALYSFLNLGYNSVIQNQMIYMFGYDNSMYLGFTIAIVSALVLPKVNTWIEQGKTIGEIEKDKQQ